MKLRKFWSVGAPPGSATVMCIDIFGKNCEGYPFMYLASTCMRIEYKYQRSRMRVRKSLYQITTYIQRYSRLFQVEHKWNTFEKLGFNYNACKTFLVSSRSKDIIRWKLLWVYNAKNILAHLPLQPVSRTTEETSWEPLWNIEVRNWIITSLIWIMKQKMTGGGDLLGRSDVICLSVGIFVIRFHREGILLLHTRKISIVNLFLSPN